MMTTPYPLQMKNYEKKLASYILVILLLNVMVPPLNDELRGFKAVGLHGKGQARLFSWLFGWFCVMCE
jgi:hypothetical protein